MNRLYVLINVQSGTAEKVVESLQKKTGVLLADIVESPPDIILVVQANDNQKLAELTIDALAPVEDMIKELQLLPAQVSRFALATPLAYRMN